MRRAVFPVAQVCNLRYYCKVSLWHSQHLGPSACNPCSGGDKRLRYGALMGLNAALQEPLGEPPCLKRRAVRLPLLLHVLKREVLVQEAQRHRTRGSIAVLGQDDVRLAFARGVFVIELIAVDEHDEI